MVSRNALFLMAFLLRVEGLAFFLAILAGLFTLVSKLKEKELPMERDKVKPLPVFVRIPSTGIQE